MKWCNGKLIIVAIYFLLSLYLCLVLTDFQRISLGPSDVNLGYVYLSCPAAALKKSKFEKKGSIE